MQKRRLFLIGYGCLKVVLCGATCGAGWAFFLHTCSMLTPEANQCATCKERRPWAIYEQKSSGFRACPFMPGKSPRGYHGIEGRVKTKKKKTLYSRGPCSRPWSHRHMWSHPHHNTMLAQGHQGSNQCSRLKSSMPFKCNLALQNVALLKQPFKMQSQIENEDVAWSPHYTCAQHENQQT